MKTIFLTCLLSLSISCAYAADPVRVVCVDGDTERAFVVTEAIPAKVFEGGFAPEVVCAEDGRTPKSINWIPSPKLKVVKTVIGRFQGHEIVDITFPVMEGGAANQEFEAKVLGCRTGTAVSDPILPFFVMLGEGSRNYEQVFESDAKNPFRLVVSRTIPGNGVMWGNFTFKFSDSGAWIDEIHSGGRKQKTTVTKFKPDGSVASSKELDEN